MSGGLQFVIGIERLEANVLFAQVKEYLKTTI
jgi:hypothetical protein